MQIWQIKSGRFVEISVQVSESKPLFLLCVDLSIHVIYVG